MERSNIDRQNSSQGDKYLNYSDYSDQKGQKSSIVSDQFNSGGGAGAQKPKSKVIADDDYRLLQTYFKDVGEESLLTAKEEFQIATKIKTYSVRALGLEVRIDQLTKKLEGKTRSNGCTCRVKNEKHDTPKNSEKLCERGLLKKNLNRASALMRVYRNQEVLYKERFTKSNLRLVVSIAKNYIGRGLPLAYLLQ